MSSGTPNFFSSHFNQLIISFAWEKTDLISVVENWINKENSSCTVVFSILQFDSSGKQFGSNILTRVQLSVSNTSIDCSLRPVFMSLGSQRVNNNLEYILVISIK